MVWIRTRVGARMPLSAKKARPLPCPDCLPDGPPSICAGCGCTARDFEACRARTGRPCSIIAAGLCSTCLELGPPTPRAGRCPRCGSTGVVYAVLSHFADCPKAGEFRREKRAKESTDPRSSPPKRGVEPGSSKGSSADPLS
jgi:hypothetical protein